MASIPISQFEHRVAHWSEELHRTREPLEISQRGSTTLVVLDRETYDQWKADRERLQALEIRLLVDTGERDFKASRYLTHAQVGKLLSKPRRRKRAR
jgi:PHD/YefM family antitoxin component YafN of YafNO toxin-antitoxin module